MTTRPALSAAADRPIPLSASSSEGDIIFVAGNLRSEDEEWFLQTDSDTFQLGFGPPSFREETGIHLGDGAYAEIRGRIADTGEIEVITCVIGSEEYAFRTEEGVAMSSGRFRMDSAVEQDGLAFSGRGRRAGGNAVSDEEERGGRRGQVG
jgi:hypothetical protein